MYLYVNGCVCESVSVHTCVDVNVCKCRFFCGSERVGVHLCAREKLCAYARVYMSTDLQRSPLGGIQHQKALEEVLAVC